MRTRFKNIIKAGLWIMAIMIFSVMLLTLFEDQLPAQYQPSLIYRQYIRTIFTADSTNWTMVSSNGLGDTDNIALRSAAVFEDLLWIGTDSKYPQGNAIFTLDADEDLDQRTHTNGIGSNDTFNISTNLMTVYDGKLVFASTDTLGRGRIYYISSLDSIVQVSDTNGRGDNNNDSVLVMQEFLGKLFVGYQNVTTLADGGSSIFYTDNLTTYTISDTNGFKGAALGGRIYNIAVTSAAVFNGYLWAGVYNKAGCGIFRTTDGRTWTKALSDSGFYPSKNHGKSTTVDKLIPFGEYLYAFVGDTNGVKVYRTDARRDTAWTAITFSTDSGFGAGNNDTRVSSALVYAGKLFVGTKSTRGAKVYYTRPDTNIFYTASTRGFGDTTNTEICFLVPYQGWLYAGTKNNSGGELWKTNIGLYESTGFVRSGGGDIGNVKLENSEVKSKIIQGEKAYIRTLYAHKVNTGQLVADSTDFDSIEANTAKFDTLWVVKVLDSDSANINMLLINDTLWVSDVIDVDSLDAKTFNVDSAWLDWANTTIAKAESIYAVTGRADTLWITQGILTRATIDTLRSSGVITDTLKFNVVKGDSAWITQLIITRATIDTLRASGVITDSLRTNVQNADSIWTDWTKSTQLESDTIRTSGIITDTLNTNVQKSDTAWITQSIVTRETVDTVRAAGAIIDTANIDVGKADSMTISQAIITKETVDTTRAGGTITDTLNADQARVDSIWAGWIDIILGEVDTLRAAGIITDTANIDVEVVDSLNIVSAIHGAGNINLPNSNATFDSTRSNTANIDTVWSTKLSSTGAVSGDTIYTTGGIVAGADSSNGVFIAKQGFTFSLLSDTAFVNPNTLVVLADSVMCIRLKGKWYRWNLIPLP